MWTLEARTALARGAAAAAYLVAVALFVLLQEVGLKLRLEEQRAWWAGNGRDLLNGVGLAAVAASLRAFGFPLPAALVVAATVTLALFGTSIFVEQRTLTRRPRTLALAVGLAIATPVLLFPGPLLSALARTAARLFPAPG